MGFITQLVNRASYPALQRYYEAIAEENVDRVEGLKQSFINKLIREREEATSQKAKGPKYSFISWFDSERFGSTETGNLGSTVQARSLRFHVTLDVQHNFVSKVTQYPVEQNSDISDHVINQNSKFSVSAIFSNATESILNSESVVTERDQDECLRILNELRTNKNIISLSTPIDIYDNLIITNISVPKNSSVGRSIQVDIEFEQIRVVELLIVKNQQKPKGTSVNKICAPKTDEGTKIPSATGSIFYTPELQKFIDDSFKETFYGTGP